MRIYRSLKPFLCVLLGTLALFNSAFALGPATSFASSSNSDPNQTIQVSQVNPKFTITLASNRTTGYSWHLVNYDNQLLNLVNHLYRVPSQMGPGKAGQEVWTFELQKAGLNEPQMTKISLLYAQPWNMQKDTKLAVFTVAIR